MIGVTIGWNFHRYSKSEGIQFEFNDAASRGDVGEMERLEALGADPLKSPFFKDSNQYGYPAIVDAASAGQPDSLKYLLDKGADPNEVFGTETPLDLVIHRRNEAQEAINLLERHGAKILFERHQ